MADPRMVQALTLDQRMEEFGFDPTLNRAGLLPFGQNAQGQTEWAVPQAGYDMVKALITPGHVLQGGAWNPNDATDMGLNVAGAGGAVGSAPSGALGMFAGRRAATADKAALERALSMEGEGAGRDAIWNSTGWFKGPDGEWRFEIDDSQSSLTDKAMGVSLFPDRPDLEGTLSDALRHPGIDDAYRLTNEVRVGNRPGVGGSHNLDTGRITADGSNPGDIRSTLLHETQHAIQGREGFASGGSPGAMAVEWIQAKQKWDFDTSVATLAREAEATQGGDLDAAAKALTDIGIEITPEHVRAAIQRGTKQAVEMAQSSEDLLKSYGGAGSGDPGASLYRRLAGEAEARNVQTRMNMTPEERRAQAPWTTLDVPEDQLIIRRPGGL